jgi:Mlc titration factor MtfA (ptsG expression regulator)
MEDHEVDGTPALVRHDQYKTWKDVMSAEYNLLVAQSARGRATLLDSYGTQSEAEFFAVATECFFEKAEEMSESHPRLYRLLSEFYRQDPAKRSGVNW